MILTVKKKEIPKLNLKKLLNVLKISQKPLPGAKTKQSTRLDLFIHSTHLIQIPIGVHIN